MWHGGFGCTFELRQPTPFPRVPQEPKFHPVLDPARLAALPFFRDLSPAARRAMAERAVERTYEAGETLFTAGSAPAGLHVVTEGRVRVLRASAAGRRQVVHVEGPGGTLGEVPLYAGGGYPATAIATEPTRCVVLGRDAVAASIAADPDVAWLLLRRLALRVREVVDRLERVGAHDVATRLAAHLVRRAERTRGGGITLGATHAELAEELGTVREVVVRQLRRLRDA
ncbi:MAG TPA: Crp/Fnr family transcriptional regulator, partial [Gemmatimonadaceae bacterium]|nr:Crp/Fnr family transcriptional regulator [Gemmatimonadaceae bacterium]